MPNEEAELLALDALGLPTEAERERLDLAPPDAADRAGLRDAVASFAWACPPVAPPPGLKARLLNRIAATDRPVPAPALSWVMKDEGWMPHPAIAGIKFKQLALDRDKGVATLLLDVAPGTVYPAHHHAGAEECYVIAGDVIAGGRHLAAGDFHHASAGSDHAPLSTVGGCTVLLVVDARDYLG